MIERINKMNNNRLYVVADARTVILQFRLLSSIQQCKQKASASLLFSIFPRKSPFPFPVSQFCAQNQIKSCNVSIAPKSAKYRFPRHYHLTSWFLGFSRINIWMSGDEWPTCCSEFTLKVTAIKIIGRFEGVSYKTEDKMLAFWYKLHFPVLDHLFSQTPCRICTAPQTHSWWEVIATNLFWHFSSRLRTVPCAIPRLYHLPVSSSLILSIPFVLLHFPFHHSFHPFSIGWIIAFCPFSSYFPYRGPQFTCPNQGIFSFQVSRSKSNRNRS